MTLSPKLQKLFPYLALLVFFVFLILRLMIIASPITDLAGIEQNVIYSTQMLLDNGHLYTSPGKAPFAITQYTPFYYYLCATTIKVIGYTKDNQVELLYVIGRTWNLVFNLLTALLVANMAKRILSLSKNTSFLLFIISFALAFSYEFAVRPDAMCDMFGVLATYCFLSYHQGDKKNANALLLIIGTVLFTAFALFSKQSGIQLIIIFCGFCLLNKDFKSFFKLVLLTIVIYGLLLFLFKEAFPSFFENVVGGVANGLDIKTFLTYVIGRGIFVISVWPIVIFTLYLLIKNNSLFKGDLNLRLIAVCAFGMLGFATITALKKGSGTNYYILFANIALLFVAKSLSAKKEEDNTVANNFCDIAIGVYVAVMLGAFMVLDFKLTKVDAWTENQKMSATQVVEFIRTDSKDSIDNQYIFADLTTDRYLPSRQGINNALYKSSLAPQMDILEYSTGPSKIMGYQNMEDMISNGKVKYIIESEPKMKFVLLKNLAAIEKAKYRLIKSIDGYLIYKLN